MLLDYRLPDGDGLTVLRRIKELSPDTPVILMTAFSTVENAVEAMKHGAYHYLNKPFNLDDVAMTVEKALETSRLRREVRAYRSSQSREYSFDAIIGASPAMLAAKALLARVANSPASTVLLTGETGTGKDLAAKAIHYNSDRAAKPFVNITCSALPEQLLESELFGHERGAFTDARQQKRGLFETADGGTVFLDEIGEMTPGLQSKLLRFLEEKTFKRVGGLADIRVDVRVIAATNRNLEDEVKAGKFREDLFYRLQVMPVHAAAAARAARRRPAARQLLRRSLQPRVPQARAGRDAGGAGAARAVPLAGQRARAAQRHRAGDAADRPRPAGARGLRHVVAQRVGATFRLPPEGVTSTRSSASCWSRRSSGPAATRRMPDPCSESIAIRCATASRSSA